MVQGPSLSAIATLSDASASVAQHLDVTKKLKNLIIGQDQRKESAVKNGIVVPLAQILSPATKVTGKRRLDLQAGPSTDQVHEWTPEDELRLQATLVVTSLASGGSPFIPPLCAANVPRILVQLLSTNIPSRLVVAVLQALKALAGHCSRNLGADDAINFWSSTLDETSARTFDKILRQPIAGTNSRQQVDLVADFISLLQHMGSDAQSSKSILTNCGVLDTLASLLVAHAVDTKTVYTRMDTSRLPPPPPTASVPGILAAITAIVVSSNYRTHRFMLSPSIRDLFAQIEGDANESRNAFGPRHGFATPHGTLLPPLHIPSYRTVSHHQPSFGNFSALDTVQFGTSSLRSVEPAQLTGDIDHSNAVCSWLLVLARSFQGKQRLIALKLLALVVNATDADAVASSHRTDFLQKTRERERQLALLAVPLAVNLVKYANEGKSTDTALEQHDIRTIQGEACSVLALLIYRSKELQIAAVDAGAIKHVCPILKKSFDHVSLSKPMWSSRTGFTDPNTPETSRLGERGLPSEIKHAMHCRQSALQALEALASKEDIHRKAIVDLGVISFIIDSLKPLTDYKSSDPARNRSPPTPKDGNTVPVILAACNAARAMSRSVSVLRTSLIDGGIAKPLIDLLSHTSVEVQIAATDVCCNLLPDFSPMREDLSANNVVRTLTSHARSSSPALRLSSLWALKHLVYSCPKEVKLATLEELGTDWLVGIIQGEQRESSSFLSSGGVSVGLSSANAAGEQIDLLNPSSMDIDAPGTGGEDAFDEDDGEVLFDEASSTHYQSSQLRSTLNPPPPTFNSTRYLSSIRDMEQNDEYAAKRDEVAIQQQALDFIRNFISGEDCATMIDHIINRIGSTKLYELLTAKLSPLPRSTSSSRQVYGPTELVLSTIHVIIHLANAPRYCQMLIAQKPLLQAMLPHFNHLDHRVRVMSVWAVNSLTWIEADSDRRDAHQRARELKAVGIEQAVRALQNDSNLDVRERVKTAIRHFEML